MAIKKATCFVIKALDYSESDLILTVFSLRNGKFSLIAKAARKTDSRFGSSLDLLNLNEIIYYEGKNLDFLSEAHPINSFTDLKADYDKAEMALRMARNLNRLVQEGQSEPRVFRLFRQILKNLEEADGNLVIFELGFALKLLALLGHKPELATCVECERRISQRIEKIGFSYPGGGVVCEECLGEETEIIGKDVLLSLRKALQSPIEKIDRLILSEQVLESSQDLIQKFVSYHLRSVDLFE